MSMPAFSKPGFDLIAHVATLEMRVADLERRLSYSEALRIASSPVTRIVFAASQLTGLDPVLIVSNRREPQVVRVRDAVAWVAREATTRSYPEIGRALRRDHSSVLTAVKRADELRRRDAEFRSLTDRLLTAVTGDQPIAIGRPVPTALSVPPATTTEGE